MWGLKQLITGATRIGLNDGILKKSCIDNILTNSEHIMEVGVLDWNFSDHLMVVARRKRAVLNQSKIEFKGRSYKDYVKEVFQEGLIDTDWEQFYASVNPSQCWEIILDKVRTYLNITCPQKTFKVREHREPWVTNEILEEIKDKDRVLREAKRSGVREDWVYAKAERNRVGRLVEQAKADFLKEQQQQLADDPKKFWRLVKSVVPGKNKGNSRISLTTKLGNGQERDVEGPQVPEFINSFFCGIGPKLAEQHNEPWHFYGEAVNAECPQLSTDFEQILKLCKDIKTTKSSDIEDVSAKVFKDAFMVIIPQLMFMFNLSFSKGFFPDAWKKATVIPLYKGGNKTDVSNYRPVSLLPYQVNLSKRLPMLNSHTFWKTTM